MSLNTKTIVIARDLTDAEKRVLRSKKKVVKSAKIAVDAVALIVNKENPLEMLTVGEVADIIAGRSMEWWLFSRISGTKMRPRSWLWRRRQGLCGGFFS